MLLFSIFTAIVMAEITSTVEIPARGAGDTLAIFLSGDGGWRKIDQDISSTLASQGIHVIGFNSMKYFWKKRTPEDTANGIGMLINSYISKTGRKKVILIGYSFGADVMPFIINRLPEKTRSKLAGAVLLGVEPDAAFEITADEWLGRIRGDYATLPEILKIDDMPLVFIEGSNDNNSMIKNLHRKNFEVMIISGGHHFDGDYKRLAWIIINWNKKNSRAR